MEGAHTSMPLTGECQVQVEWYRISLSIQHYNAIYIGNNCCCNIIMKHSLKYHTPRIANAFYKLSCKLYIPQMILKINLQHAFRHCYHLVLSQKYKKLEALIICY